VGYEREQSEQAVSSTRPRPLFLWRLTPSRGAGTEIAVFRIVQECLTNVHRHSGSVTATIRIKRDGSRVVVQVQDRGKGISAEKQRELTVAGRAGVGFGGMRERLRQLGGTLEIQSEGNGTTVSAVLAVRSDTEHTAAAGARLAIPRELQ
jgi:signal transduction histidine kinase